MRGEPHEQSTHQTAGGAEASFLALLRDEAAYFIEEHGPLLRSLGCGAALGWAAYSACANFLTPLQMWAVPVAIGIVILSAVELWTAAFAACLIWTVQLLQFQAEMGWLAGILSIVFLSLYAFGPGRACTVLIAPFLMPVGVAAAVPLGLGLGLGRKSGWFWAALAYAWTAAHAFLFGQWRLGVARGRLWEIVAEKAFTQPQGFNSAWLKSIVGNLEFTRLKVEALGFASNSEVWTPLLLQWIVWIVAAWCMGYLYTPKRTTDRAALEYLAKASSTSVSKVKNEPMYRKLPGAVALGALIFIFSHTILAMVFDRLKYDPVPEALLDLAAAALVLLPFYIVYEGFPDNGKRAKGRRLAQKAGIVKKQSATGLTAGSTRSRSSGAIGTSGISTRELSREVKGVPSLPKGDLERPTPIPRRSTLHAHAGSEAPASKSGWRIGEKIDNQYSVVKEHLGGMGIVYEVVDDFSGKKYAVKSLRDDLLDNHEAIARCGIEATTWLNMEPHPHIVQALMYRVVNGRPLLFMEFIDGIDLDRQQKLQGPFSIAQVIEWAKQIGQGLAYAHHKDVGGGRIGVIHRDLKPANLMVTREGTVKITDFGLAKVADAATHLTRQATGLGTLAYMPPEQLEDARSVDRRADIYAFGAVIYELLTGEPPATGESVANLTLSILKGQIEPPSRKNPAIPPALDAIILRCLEKDRDRRYGEFAPVLQELSQIPITPEMRMAAGQPAQSRSWTPPPGSTPMAVHASAAAPSRHASTPGHRVGSSGMVTTSIEAILFLDMVGSTALGSNFGDDLVLQMKERLGNIVNLESNRQKMLFSKGTGDGFMITFPEAANGRPGRRGHHAARSGTQRGHSRVAGIETPDGTPFRTGQHRLSGRPAGFLG
jgi:serine/threonine protein kinase